MGSSDRPAEQHPDVHRESSEKYRILFNALQEGVTVLELMYGPDGRPVDYIIQDVNGKRGRELVPDLEEHWLLAYHRVVETGEPVRLEAYNQSMDRWFCVHASRVGGPGSRLVAVVWDDVTDRRTQETQKSLLAAISDDFARLSTEDEITKAIGARLAKHLGITSCSVADLAGGIATVRSAFRSPGSDEETPARLKVSDYLNEELQAAARAGETMVIRDMRTDPRVDALRCEALGVRAGIIVPFQVAGEWRHSFAVGAPTARDWRDDQIQLVKEVASRYFPRIERARVEEALRAGEERLRALVTASSDVVYRMSADWTEMRHLRGQDFIADTDAPTTIWMDKYIPPEEQPMVRARIQEAVRTKSMFELEHRVRRVDGSLGWTFSRAAPLKDEAGSVLEWVGMASDVTERKRADHALRQSERRWRLLARLNDRTRALTDPEAIVEAAVELLREALDADRCAWAEVEADESHFTFVKVVTAPGVPSVSGRYRMDSFGGAGLEPLRGGRVFVTADLLEEPSDTRALRATGIRGLVAAPVQLGGRLGAVLGAHMLSPRAWTSEDVELVRQVADRCGEAIERARIERALRESEDRYRTVVNAQTEVLCRFTRDGTITFANAAYARALATTPEALLGHSFWPFVQTEEREAVAAMLERLTPETPEVRIENHFVSAEGVRWTLWSNRALTFDGRGRWVEAQSSGIDITDRKRMEEELRQADQRKDEFLAMLGHELRNPLAPMRLIFATARRRGEKQVSGKQFDILDRQSAALSRLVDDLLDVARITRGKIELRKEVVAVGALVSRAVDSVAQLIDERRHELTITLPHQPLLIEVDPLRLEQVLVNLLVNAARYTNPGGRINLSGHRTDEGVEIRVKDTGVGLDPDEREGVFQLFTQAQRSPDRAPGGLGLGLTIVRSLVEMHQGRVYAESAGRGHGSEFVVELPVATIASGASTKRATPASAPTGTRLRVLVVDDNQDAAESLREVVEELGHDVHVVHDGLAAVDAARTLLPDLILLDIGLPSIDGYEAARRIRAEGSFSGLLVAVTGYGQASDRWRAFDAGFAHHLVKPVQLDDLVDTVRVAENRSERGMINGH